MSYKTKLLEAVKTYCEKTGRERGGIANIIVNDGKFFDRIENGGGCTVDTYEKVMQWFSQNKPKPPNRRRSSK